MKTISIIIPIYYGEQYIDHLLNQIEKCREYLNSSEYNFEVVFVNDAPDVQIKQIYDNNLMRIIVINTDSNVGIHAARIKGLKRSSGELILFLDQDDRIKPEYFSSQLLSMGQGDAVVCRVIHGNEDFYSNNDTFKHMICKKFILGVGNAIVSPGQVLIRRDSIPNIWIENILKHNGADDWMLWLCMIAKGCNFSLNYDILHEHVLHDSNASNDYVGMMQSEEEVIEIVKEKKIFSNEDYEVLVAGFLKKCMTRTKCLSNLLDSVCKHDTLLDNWMQLKDYGIKLSSFFEKYEYYKIAVYGVGKLGKHLFYELNEESIEVVFGIDKNSECVMYPVPVYSLEQQILEVDVIVITVIDQYDEIYRLLSEKTNCAIISLEKIIQELKHSKLKNTI